PVFMLDEIDKIGADWRGDPSSALLEVLDPAQNNSFVDTYLGVPFDLSQVLFIATGNTLDTIPGPLRDRMEILTLSGYTDEEKVGIATQYLGPPRFFDEVVERTSRPGVATGLAWTPVGGDVLFVEVTMMPSSEERLVLTGMLGVVMRESAQAAVSYVWSNAEAFGIDPKLF